jgi:hypothetical protein
MRIAETQKLLTNYETVIYSPLNFPHAIYMHLSKKKI